ncbi:MAG TPA: chromosome segregation protein ScpA, partial [Acidobacteriaceae bacterium]|nr:chromosome segregation protein ScpA [Acidobacteriaceae bacterium]
MADEQENMAAKPSAEAPPVPAEEQKPAPPKKDADSAYPFSVTVGHVYDGPLDLLLDLIRKQDIDIYDIPIAKITAQFLAYVEQL